MGDYAGYSTSDHGNDGRLTAAINTELPLLKNTALDNSTNDTVTATSLTATTGSVSVTLAADEMLLADWSANVSHETDGQWVGVALYIAGSQRGPEQFATAADSSAGGLKCSVGGSFSYEPASAGAVTVQLYARVASGSGHVGRKYCRLIIAKRRS